MQRRLTVVERLAIVERLAVLVVDLAEQILLSVSAAVARAQAGGETCLLLLLKLGLKSLLLLLELVLKRLLLLLDLDLKRLLLLF